MKTVKFSLNELMSEIDESFIEEVYFHFIGYSGCEL